MVYKLFRAFAFKHSGVECRVCGDSVPRSDHFGLSEGVCPTCR